MVCGRAAVTGCPCFLTKQWTKFETPHQNPKAPLLRHAAGGGAALTPRCPESSHAKDHSSLHLQIVNGRSDAQISGVEELPGEEPSTLKERTLKDGGPTCGIMCDGYNTAEFIRAWISFITAINTSLNMTSSLRLERILY